MRIIDVFTALIAIINTIKGEIAGQQENTSDDIHINTGHNTSNFHDDFDSDDEFYDSFSKDQMHTDDEQGFLWIDWLDVDLDIVVTEIVQRENFDNEVEDLSADESDTSYVTAKTRQD